jgi:hypothetical protein
MSKNPEVPEGSVTGAAQKQSHDPVRSLWLSRIATFGMVANSRGFGRFALIGGANGVAPVSLSLGQEKP